MVTHRPPSILTTSNAVYALLLRACPASYRRTYGPLMRQAFADLAREAYTRRGAWGILVLWLRILPDACRTALAEHIVALKERRTVADVALATSGAKGGYTMRSTLSTTGARALSIGTLLVGVFCIWPFYALAAYALTWHLLPGSIVSSPPFSWLGTPMLFWTYPPSVFLGDLGRYLAVSAAGIVLALAALLFGPRRRLLLAAEAVTLVAILAFPWLLHYQPPVAPAPGGVLYVPTRPGLLDGAVKELQVFAELIPGDYEVLGWSSDSVLYYRETVKATQTTRTWAYTPGEDARPHLVATPTGIVPTAVAPRKLLLERVRAPAWGASVEPTLLSSICQDGVASPDGRWAAAIANHIYGPKDIFVVGLD